MRHVVVFVCVVILGILLCSPMVVADPALPLPRLPILGDQDGSEQPLVLNASGFDALSDVQNFRVPGSDAQDIIFDFVFREAAYQSEFGYFRVDDTSGTIDSIKPGAPGYLDVAFKRAAVVFPSGSAAFTPDVKVSGQGGDLFVFFIVQDNTLANLRANNPTNDINKRPLAFFSIDSLNPDQVDHFVGFRHSQENITQFGFEDLTGGGDRDYDDIVYNIKLALLPSPTVRGRDLVFVRGIDSTGDCGSANSWVKDYLSSPEGKAFFGNVSIGQYLNFSYAGSGSYICPREQPAYTEQDTCDGIAHAASDLKTLIDAEANAPVTIVAHSMGGLVSAYLVASQADWAKMHIASVITFDSPLRGVSGAAAWAKTWLSACDKKPNLVTHEASIADLEDGSTIVATAARAATIVPFYPLDATKNEKGVVQVVSRERTRLDSARSFLIADQCGVPGALSEPNCQPSASFNDNHSEIWNRRYDSDKLDKALMVGCAAVLAFDCTFLTAQVTPNWAGTRTANDTTLTFDIESGATRIRFTDSYSGTVRMHLTAPDGTVYGPDGLGPVAAYEVDNDAEVYEVSNPATGTWTVTLQPIQIVPQGEAVKVAYATLQRAPLMVKLPPTANAGYGYRSQIGAELTFHGNDSFDADGLITRYEWDFESDGVIDFRSTNPVATHVYPGRFVGIVTLRVTDNDNNTATATAAVRIENTLYLPLIAKP